MFLTSLFQSSRSATLSSAEEELGSPSEAEHSDLPLHVGRCAQRWKVLYRQNLEQSRTLDAVKACLVVLILLAMVNTSVNVSERLVALLSAAK